MAIRGERAVSTLIGFILLFGILIVSFSVYQGFVIPDQNERTEFEHNRKAQTQVLNVKDAMLRSGTTGVSQSSTVQVGAEYTRRELGLNLGLTGGAIRTRNTTDDGSNTLTLKNIEALDSETDDYVDGSDLPFETKSLVYEPTYSNYQGAPDTVITGGVGAVINSRTDYSDKYNFSIADQVLIDRNTITVVAIDGNLSKAVSGESSSITVDTEGLSVAERSVTVENISGAPPILEIPTQIKDESVWTGSAGLDPSELSAVADVTQSGDMLTVELETDRTYTLRMMKVGVGTGASDPGPEYITDVDTPKSVADGTSTKLIYEVRDKFNNPRSGIQVNASILRDVDNSKEDTPSKTEELSVVGDTASSMDGDAAGGDRIQATTSNGRIVLNYTAPNVTQKGSVKLNVSILTNGSTAERVITTFTVFNTDGGADSGSSTGDGSSDETNPKDGNVQFSSVSFTGGDTVDVSLSHSGDTRTVTGIRIPFYFDAQSNNNNRIEAVEEIQQDGGPVFTGSQPMPTGEIGNNFNINSNTILTFDFDNTVNNGGSKDFYTFTLVYDNGNVATFFIAPN